MSDIINVIKLSVEFGIDIYTLRNHEPQVHFSHKYFLKHISEERICDIYL
jgi:hypothetical protein